MRDGDQYLLPGFDPVPAPAQAPWQLALDWSDRTLCSIFDTSPKALAAQQIEDTRHGRYQAGGMERIFPRWYVGRYLDDRHKPTQLQFWLLERLRKRRD